MPGVGLAAALMPRRVVRFPTTLATIRSTRSRRQARATGELGAANVVLSFEQFLRMGDLVRGWCGMDRPWAWQYSSRRATIAYHNVVEHRA
jgi:hypothetical protein